jgi:hypothetical protein
VLAGTASKVKVLHSLFSVNTDPDNDTVSSVIGFYRTNRVAPFKTFSATVAVQPRTPPARRVGAKKGDPELLWPSIQQFSAARNAKEFRDIVGNRYEKLISALPVASLPSCHFIHPQVFIDIKGKREWMASDLGYKLVTLCDAKRGKKKEDDNMDKDDDNNDDNNDDDNDNNNNDNDEEEEEAGPDHRGPVPAPSIPLGHSQAMWKPSYSQGDAGRGAELITSLCKRKALNLAGRAPSTTGESMTQGAALLESKRLTDAMVANLNKSSEVCVCQINNMT